MPKKVVREAETPQVEPEGQLPANTPTTNGKGRSAGSGNCPPDEIWSAQDEGCVKSNTGNAGRRTLPEPVARASETDSDELEGDGVDVEPVDGSEDPDDNTGDPKSSLDDNTPEPEIEPTKVTENRRGRDNADLRSERRRQRSYEGKIDKVERLEKVIRSAESRIKAKELLAKEKMLDAKIRQAREAAKPRAIINKGGSSKAVGAKASAVETEISKPSAWFRAVQREENVSPSYMWHINKQKIYENYGQQFYKQFDRDGNEVKLRIPRHEVGKSLASEAVNVSGPPTGDFMRIMSEQVLVLPNGKVVTPVRQFCDTKILPSGTREAFFYDFGPVTFAAIDEGNADAATATPVSSPVIRSAGTNATPRGTRIDIGYTQVEESPIDIIAAANRSFALESINDESTTVISTAYNTDSGSAGDATNRKAIGGGAKTNRWVNGNTGSTISADSSGLGKLTYKGLLAAKGIIEDEGLDPSNIITYTTGKGIRDLTVDPDLDSYIGHSRPGIITEATVERIAGTNLVRASQLADASQSGGSRSVMFIPNVAFGLIVGRDLTMEAQRRNEFQIIHLTGTQRIAAVVKNVEATVRISHL